MPLFGTPVENDTRYFGGEILGVDNNRQVCKVYTDFKQTLDGVPWMSEDDPVFGDRVLITTVLGYPTILGVLDVIGEPASYSPDIDTGQSVDTGNFSQLGRGLTNNPEKPEDLVSGDKITSNSMGGIFGLLRGGSFIARASKLAQILLSKYDDLVRIIGRNYELYTDAGIEVLASVRGRIYKFVGYADTLANSRGDVYKYREYYGDTVIATTLGANYYGLDPVTFAAIPAANDIIRKYIITASPNPLFYQDVHLTGQYYTQVQNSAGTAYTYVNQTNATFDIKTLNGTYVQITTTPTAVTLTYNGTNTAIITDTKIEVNFGGNHKAVLDANKIELDYEGIQKATLDSSQVSLTANSGSHFVTVNSSGVQLG